MSQQIDKTIVLKIHQLVGEGVKQVREMQRHIRIFVKMKLFETKNYHQLHPRDTSQKCQI